MNSYLTEEFIQLFRSLPTKVQRQARKNYLLWKGDMQHPSLHFKRIQATKKLYSIRVGIGWRAFGIKDEEDIVWFWIGSHNEYQKMLRQLR